MVSRGRRTAPLATTIALSGWASLATDLPFIYGSLERSSPIGPFPVALPDTVAFSFAHFATRCQTPLHSAWPVSLRAAKNGRTPLGPFPVALPDRKTPLFQPTLAFIGRAVGVAGLYLSFNYEAFEELQLQRPLLTIGTHPPRNKKSRRNSCDRSFAR